MQILKSGGKGLENIKVKYGLVSIKLNNIENVIEIIGNNESIENTIQNVKF